ncbi:MAG: hypothetical protein ACRDJN_18745, partial [Chloroflexota bacterium]
STPLPAAAHRLGGPLTRRGASMAAPVPFPAPATTPARAVLLADAARRHAAAGRGRAALAAVRRIALPRLRGAILAAVAPQLPDDLLETAVTLAGRLEDTWARAVALAGLLTRLPTSRRRAALIDVQAAAQALDWSAGDVILRDVARALAAAGDDASARRLLDGIREDGPRHAVLATLATGVAANAQPDTDRAA